MTFSYKALSYRDMMRAEWCAIGGAGLTCRDRAIGPVAKRRRRRVGCDDAMTLPVTTSVALSETGHNRQQPLGGPLEQACEDVVRGE